MRKLRTAMDAEEHRQLSTILCEHTLSQLFRPAASRRQPLAIVLYVPFRAEPDIWPLFQWGWEQGHRIIVPKVEADETKRLGLYHLHNEGDLEDGTWGIREPKAGAARWRGRVDFVVVPGLAFARDGMRLGYGGGFYDRLRVTWSEPQLLSSHDEERARSFWRPTFVALAFHFQLIERVPAEPHDQPVDLIITEKETVRITGTC